MRQHNTYKADSYTDYEKTLQGSDVLSIEKMKRRALHLRMLIDSSRSRKEREKAIREYVSLITRISRNN